MMFSFTIAQIEHFKREAKRLHRSTHISHSQALDQIANTNGYHNWSLLMKHNDVHDTLNTKGVKQPLQFTRTPMLMRLALRKVPESRGQTTSADYVPQQVEDLSSVFTSPQNAIEFAINYVKCLLTVPRFSLHPEATAYWEMRSWLPYACLEVENKNGVHIPVNRNYKPVGQVDKTFARYLEFPNLHTRFESHLLGSFSFQGSDDGYLFNDSSAPWRSRADAVTYLGRLHALYQVLHH